MVSRTSYQIIYLDRFYRAGTFCNIWFQWMGRPPEMDGKKHPHSNYIACCGRLDIQTTGYRLTHLVQVLDIIDPGHLGIRLTRRMTASADNFLTCSSYKHLFYRPKRNQVIDCGAHTSGICAAFCRKFRKSWCNETGSNRRPPVCNTGFYWFWTNEIGFRWVILGYAGRWW